MKYLKLFESKKSGWERKSMWIRFESFYDEDDGEDEHPESMMDFFEYKIVNTTSVEIDIINKNLEKRGLSAIKCGKWWNIRNNKDRPRVGDFLVDATFFKIDDEYFIYMDNRENSQLDDNDEDGHEEIYFKCDQLYGLLELLDLEFDGF